MTGRGIRPVVVACLCILGPVGLLGQDAGTRYLPIDSWVTPYVEHLIRAGVLRDVDPLTRPFRRLDLARAISAIDTTGIDAATRATIHMIAAEVTEQPAADRWSVEGYVASLGASDAGRWAQRPQAQHDDAYVSGGLTGVLAFPHLAIVTSPYFDTRLKRDTQFTGRQDRVIAGDNAESYVLAGWKYFDLFLGIEPRNWGPPEADGFLLSPSPYPFDHLMVRFGPQRLRLEMVSTQLDNMPIAGQATQARRFVSLHRLVVLPSNRLGLSFSEGVLYADTGGVPRSFEPWYLNPANLWLLVDVNGYGGTTKDYLSAAATYGFHRGVRLAGEFFANDIKVDARTATNPEKRPQFGWTMSATGPWTRESGSWSLLYTRVDNLVYQTQKGTQFDYLIRGVGIGRDHIDYDQLTARLHKLVAPRTLAAAEFTVIRQGEGALGRPFPPNQVFATDSVTFLTGTVERTIRIAGQLDWQPTPGFTLHADVGRHFIRNAGHMIGSNGDRWVWRIRGEYRRRVSGPVRLPD